MAAEIPSAKLIYLVRDPVVRALASYVEERHHSVEPRSLEAAFADIDDPYNPYIAASRYAEQLSLYRQHFSDDQIRVISLDDLRDDPAGTMRSTFEFLGVQPDVSVDATLRHNTRSEKVEFGAFGNGLRRSSLGKAIRRLPPGWRDTFTRPARKVLLRPITGVEPTPELRRRIEEALSGDADEFRRITGMPFDEWSV